MVSLRADGLRLPRRDIRTGKITWAQANYPAVHDILERYSKVFDNRMIAVGVSPL